jgi:hypothetical protein
MVRKPKAVSLANYPFLKQLGITKNNSGVYHTGAFHRGKGQTVTYANPTTGEVVA